MKVGVIGSTGYVGKSVVAELAKRGHEVTAFARNTNKVIINTCVKAVSIDVNSQEFSTHLNGLDAVVSAFNPGWDNPNIAEDFEKGAESINQAAKNAAVPYILIIGGAGSLYVAPNVQLIDTDEFPKDIYNGANAARNLLKKLQDRNDFNWAFISPPAMFYDGSSSLPTGKYRIGDNDVLMNGSQPAGIHVDDLAIAIADDIEKQAHLHKRFTVAEI